jgi:hypothetical protein
MQIQQRASVYGTVFVFTALHIITFDQLATAGIISQTAAKDISNAIAMFVMGIMAVAVSDFLEILLEDKRLAKKGHVVSLISISAFVVIAADAGVSIWYGIVAGVLPALSISGRAGRVPERVDQLQDSLEGRFA